MLFLQFELGRDRYLLDVARIVEVLPMVDIRALPQAPAGVAGICNYRGAPLPVIDLSRLMLGVPARASMSTRIVVVDYPNSHGEFVHRLGMIAERATQTLRLPADAFQDTGVDNPASPYLGPVATDEHGMLQWVDASCLLPDSVRDLLFSAQEPA